MPDHLPLSDVKILDFMWVMAGPASTRILADYGATVVRIESPTRVDTTRTLQPYHGNKLGPDTSGLFANCKQANSEFARPGKSCGARHDTGSGPMGGCGNRVVLKRCVRGVLITSNYVRSSPISSC